MLKSLSVKGFLSHKDSLFQLHPGVNVISGDSDAGKSSAVHALELLLLNRVVNKSPGWSVYKSWFRGTRATEVTAEFVNITVTRKRTSTDNTYRLSTLPSPLEAVGTQQPSQVLDATRMTALNLGNQHGKYFLLEETPGAVASYLNDMAGIGIIDTFISTVSSMGRRTSEEFDRANAEAARLALQLVEYEVLDQIEPLVDEALQLEALISGLKDGRDRLRTITQPLEVQTNASAGLVEWLSIRTFYEKLVITDSDLTALKAKACRLKTLIANLRAKIDELATLNTWLGVRASLAGLTALADQIDALENEQTNLTQLTQQWAVAEDKKTNVVEQLYAARIEYEVVLVQAGVCPTCGSPVNEDVLCNRVWEAS